ncbi:hypothetical protein EAF04_000085 [Stromatinia cepivora]|nr:hypothetical protein EAF04_000085 [Stromatinia cepivora]
MSSISGGRETSKVKSHVDLMSVKLPRREAQHPQVNGHCDDILFVKAALGGEYFVLFGKYSFFLVFGFWAKVTWAPL